MGGRSLPEREGRLAEHASGGVRQGSRHGGTQEMQERGLPLPPQGTFWEGGRKPPQRQQRSGQRSGSKVSPQVLKQEALLLHLLLRESMEERGGGKAAGGPFVLPHECELWEFGSRAEAEGNLEGPGGQ